jgi:PAS domain S-box-containing protein
LSPAKQGFAASDRARRPSNRQPPETSAGTPGRGALDPAPRAKLGGEVEAQLALLDLVPDAIFARRPDRVITFWNKGAEETYGWRSDEAIGATPLELLRTEYPIPLEEIERIVAETGYWEGDLVQHTREGLQVTVESRWAAQYAPDGSIRALLEVNRDITARLEAQAEHERLKAEAERERLHNSLHESQRLESLGQLAGGIAHDFNNLLAVVINYAEFVAQDVEKAAAAPGGERWTSTGNDVEQIRRASARAVDLTHQLLAFARRDAVESEAIDVNDVVHDIEQLLKRTLGEHVELVSCLASGLWRVEFNPGQLEQILVNLAVNARDAMPDGGRLTIDTANVDVDETYVCSHPELSPGRYVRLRVSDTGTGMRADVVRRAFDPFFTTKPPGQGTGLGLATVYGIVKQADGRAQLYSEEGIGTTFTALLPATTSYAPRSHPEPQPTPCAGEQTILLVEDERALREVTARILRGHGYRVACAADGEEALALARELPRPVDLLLTDAVMPHMPGPQLARELRLEQPQLRVLMISGFAEPVLGAQGQLSGGAELLDKPFSAPVLLAKVAQALRRDPWRPAAGERPRRRPRQAGQG